MLGTGAVKLIVNTYLTEQKMILSHIMSRRRRGIDEAHDQEGRYLTMYLVGGACNSVVTRIDCWAVIEVIPV